jgi:hypothetical protein
VHVDNIEKIIYIVEVGSLEQLAGEGDDARATVVGEEDKHVVVGAALQDLAGANTLHLLSLALEHLGGEERSDA